MLRMLRMITLIYACNAMNTQWLRNDYAMITHIVPSFTHCYAILHMLRNCYAILRMLRNVTQHYAGLRMIHRFTHVYAILRMLRMLHMITLIYACYAINMQ